MTKPCFVANWKMNKTRAEAEVFFRDFDRMLKGSTTFLADLVLAPPFTALSTAAETVDAAEIALGAQNMHYEKSGAFTGEISGDMLRELGCRYVIIGHSERRQHFGETHVDVHRKLMAAQTAGLRPIFCIGESAEDRQAGKTWTVLEKQLSEGLGQEASNRNLSESISEWLIAYEPVWAIGTGETPRPSEAAAVHARVDDFFEKRFGQKTPRVLYGGSISEKNIEDFMKEAAIDGALVGGASLSSESFYTIAALGARTKSQSTPVTHS